MAPEFGGPLLTASDATITTAIIETRPGSVCFPANRRSSVEMRLSQD